MRKYISVGKILNFHGVQGEAKVGFSKSQQDFFMGLKEVFIKKDNEYLPFEITSIRLNKTFALVKFKGISSINELLQYKSCLIFVTEDIVRETLEEDEFLIDELVGMGIFDTEDKSLGFVVGVSNNGANDLLSVKVPDGNVYLVPFVKAIVPTVDVKNKKIIVNNLEGLLS